MTNAAPLNRIVVIGTSGSGKTTFAHQLAQQLDCPHIELDAIYWNDDWKHLDDAETQDAFAEAVRGDRWVVDGNYRMARSVVWPKAEMIIWLDYPRWLVMWRILRRTYSRASRRTTLWNTNNVESWRRSLFSSDSILLWGWTTYERRHREYDDIFTKTAVPEFQHLRFVRLSSPREAEIWLHEFNQAAV
jgi:adenylate kinase family enzyme